MPNSIFPIHVYTGLIQNNLDNSEDLTMDNKFTIIDGDATTNNSSTVDGFPSQFTGNSIGDADSVATRQTSYSVFSKHIILSNRYMFNHLWTASDQDKLGNFTVNLQQIVLQNIIYLDKFTYVQCITKRYQINKFKELCEHNVEDILMYLQTMIDDTNWESKCNVCPELIIAYLTPYLTPQQRLYVNIIIGI